MSKHWRILGVLATQRSVHPYFDIEQKSTVQVSRNFYAEGDTLSDAIRNAGIRCKTCEHWEKDGFYESYGRCDGPVHVIYNGELNTEGDFFCAHHSSLVEGKKP